MVIFFALAAMVVAFALVWRGHDVRVVLFAAALAVGAAAGETAAVFRKTAEAFADAKFLLPICSAMGFAFVVRETGCVDALVRLLVRPIARVPRLALPGTASVAFVVNAAIPSQTSTLAAVGPLSVALHSRLGARAGRTGAALVLGASISGALLNPGLAEVVTVARVTRIDAPEIVVVIALAVVVSFVAGLAALAITTRLGIGRDDAPLEVETVAKTGPLAETSESATKDEHAKTSERASAEATKGKGAWWLRALLPPLPIAWLLLDHPALPTHALLGRVMLPGLEVFTAMIVGSALVIAIATRERAHATRAMFEGAGYALTHVITIIAVSAGAAKALEVAGVLSAFVGLVEGNPMIALAAAFALAFVMAVLSGSGTASSVALVTAIAPHAQALGVTPLTLGAVILLGAEAGRTTSPVAAVLLFGSNLVRVPTRSLALRLVIPCFVGSATGALFYVITRGV